MKALKSLLRRLGVQLCIYLDDILLMADSHGEGRIIVPSHDFGFENKSKQVLLRTKEDCGVSGVLLELRESRDRAFGDESELSNKPLQADDKSEANNPQGDVVSSGKIVLNMPSIFAGTVTGEESSNDSNKCIASEYVLRAHSHSKSPSKNRAKLVDPKPEVSGKKINEARIPGLHPFL